MSRRLGWGGAVLAILFSAACAKSPPDVPVAEDPPATEATTTTTLGKLPPDEDDTSGVPIANPMIPPAPPLSKSPTCRTQPPGSVTSTSRGSTTPLSTAFRLATTTTVLAVNPLANVHDPDRFKVITPCVTVSGRVQSVHTDPDGDVHFELQPDDPFVGLLNDKNKVERRGGLVVKIVPADRPGCAKGQPIRPGRPDYGTCTGAAILSPSPSSHVAVTGPYVLNRIRGWMEIHPAWSVTQQTAVPTTVPPTVRPIPTFPLPGSSPPTTSFFPLYTTPLPPFTAGTFP